MLLAQDTSLRRLADTVAEVDPEAGAERVGALAVQPGGRRRLGARYLQPTQIKKATDLCFVTLLIT